MHHEFRVRHPTCRWLGSALCLLTCVVLARAQESPDSPEQSDPYDQPSEHGIRFTPGMARGIARLWTNEVLIKHYEMDASKADEANEAIARRLMKLAHHNEEAGQELAEYTFTTMFDIMARNRQENMPGIPPELAQGVAKRLLPFMPAVRDMVDGVVQDVRPMLGLKGQLKMTGELTVVKMGMDAFEKNMEKWSKGDVDPFSDPFRSENEEVKKEEDGQSKSLKNALRSAESWAGREPGAEWDRYIEEAKKYYDLDPSQAAAADSLLREYKLRAVTSVGGPDQWRARIYRNRLWWSMSTQMPGRWNNPLRTLLDVDYAKAQEPIEQLGRELKNRVEAIPTQAQRDAAERRLLAVLAEKGLKFDDEPVPATEPVAAATQPAADHAAVGPEDVE